VTINGGYPEDLIGKNVRFRDLVSRSDLNGERGTILDWLDSRQRYNVKVDNGEVIAVKPSNLSEIETVVKNETFWDDPTEGEKLVAEGFMAAQRLSGATVEFQWLSARSDLNGKKAVVEVFLEDRERYNVKIAETGETIAVKPGNIKTIPPYTHHYLKKLAEEQEEQKRQWAKIHAGDMITVKDSITTDSKEPVQVPKGTRGTVVRMDNDGDACIKFDDIKDRHWVYKDKFSRLAVRMSAQESTEQKSPLKSRTTNNQSQGPQVAGGKPKGRKNSSTGLREGLF